MLKSLKMNRLWLFFTLWVVLCIGTLTAEGYMYRGNPARTGNLITNPVINFPTIKWAANLKCGTFVGPIATPTLVIVSCPGELAAFDRQTGTKIWSRLDIDMFDGAPAVLDDLDRVYLSEIDGLSAINLNTGATIWHKPVHLGVVDSAVVVNGMLYMGGNDGYVYALNATTGAVVWSVKLGTYVGSSIAVADGIVYAVSSEGNAAALDAEEGFVIWTVKLSSGVITALTVDATHLYVPAGTAFYALDKITGETAWTYEANYEPLSAAALAYNLVLVAWDPSTMVALDSSTGKLVWSVDCGVFGRSAPIVVDNIVYIGDQAGYVTARNVMTGEQVWAFQTGAPIGADCFVDNGELFVAANTTLFALD